MAKIRLDLDALSVESFSTAPNMSDRNGTVFGHRPPWSEPSYCPCEDTLETAETECGTCATACGTCATDCGTCATACGTCDTYCGTCDPYCCCTCSCY